MEIKKLFRKKEFIELDAESYNDLMQNITFLKEHDIRAHFSFNKDDCIEPECVIRDWKEGEFENWRDRDNPELNDHYDGTR